MSYAMTTTNLEIVADQGDLCGEGPLWDPVDQRLYWTDAAAKAVHVLDRSNGAVRLLTSEVQVSAIALHADGGLLFAGGQGFARLSREGKLESISVECDGKAPNQLNEMIADPRGRVFAGQQVYSEQEQYQPGCLFRLDPGRRLFIVEEGLHVSNGMAFSPDHRTFYLVDSVPRNIYAYDYDLETGNISNRRTLVTLGREDGLPDGITVDANGFLWVARWYGAGLSRYDPDGRLERKIGLPALQTSSLTSGGPELDEIYVTSAKEAWPSALAPRGYDYTAAQGGALYRLRLGIQGVPEHRAMV
ncbi:MAG TPA: SMP-30/gluconolactonase/LRE family protein [Polyangiaceae bacterium]|jgi:D-xylonolactonase